MSSHTTAAVLEQYQKLMEVHARQAAQLQASFLSMRQAGLRQMASQLERQIASSNKLLGNGATHPLFNLADLNEFASGSAEKCFGPEYAVYAGRRNPRIPNGDFLLMSRILSIHGTKGDFDRQSTILAEHDVPADAWYLSGNSHGRLPYSICIEIALQPCGFLSAYLGTSLRFPNIDYYFRNLDGEATFHALPDVRSKTIQARASLFKTVFYGAIILQHFNFELSCDGKVFFEGRSSFGFFSPEALSGQIGLDNGKQVLPRIKQARQVTNDRVMSIPPPALTAGLPSGKLHLLDSAVIDPGGGEHGQGYVYASRRNDRQDWFYPCHFFQDPVMPGSLGIEAILQAAQIYARVSLDRPVIAVPATGQPMQWTYRGQVLQNHHQMQVEVHFSNSQTLDNSNPFIGNANLWADDTRIYAVRNLAFNVEPS